MIIGNNVMRLILFFDLPVETAEQRRAYTRFHKSLIYNGFDMLQYSVYVRYCSNITAAEKYENKMLALKPEEGDVRILRVTENQYQNMYIMLGKKTKRQELENTDLIFEIE